MGEKEAEDAFEAGDDAGVSTHLVGVAGALSSSWGVSPGVPPGVGAGVSDSMIGDGVEYIVVNILSSNW